MPDGSMTYVWIGIAAVAVIGIWALLRRRPQRSVAARVEKAVGTLDEAVAARAAGDLARARAILDGIDVARGGGMRRLMRAVAMFESGDAAGARALGAGAALPGGVAMALARMQLAAAKGRVDEVAGTEAIADLARALAARAAKDETGLRRAMAALLFSDPELAALVVSKELGMDAPPSTPRAAERYASIARGRDLFATWGTDGIAAFLAFWETP